jgi:hypothetical protein
MDTGQTWRCILLFLSAPPPLLSIANFLDVRDSKSLFPTVFFAGSDSAFIVFNKRFALCVAGGGSI